MAKSKKVKIVVLEGTSELNNAALIEKIVSAIESHLLGEEFTITQKPKVQVAQSAKG